MDRSGLANPLYEANRANPTSRLRLSLSNTGSEKRPPRRVGHLVSYPKPQSVPGLQDTWDMLPGTM